MTTWTESMDGTLPIVVLQSDGFTTEAAPTTEQDEEADDGGRIIFQHGPIAEVGKNGTTIENIIDVLVNRLEGFQHGPFANDYNARALVALREAHAALTQRTIDRQARGVEGKNIA